jgi:hypothetical protein
MIAGIRARQLFVLLPVVAATLAGAIAAVAGRGADEEFLAEQKNPPRVRAEAVEELMLTTAPDPEPPHEPSGTRSRCEADGRRELRNPWHCTVEYPSGSIARFDVTIESDGSYVADYTGDTAEATGCCLDVPTPE